MKSPMWRAWCVLAATALASGCGGGSSSPTAPSSPQSFLAGTWTGTLTIEREGEPPTSAPTTWTFEVVPDTNRQSFRTTIRSDHAWLPITTTVTTAITPGSTPPARISTQGDYPSPRGCTGTLLSVGNAQATRIDADFAGIDCPSLAQSTFRGRVVLSKAGS